MHRRTFLIGVAAAGAAVATPTAAGALETTGRGGGKATVDLVDHDATSATRSLFAYLLRQQGNGIQFGHQHALTYGFTFDEPDGTSSDVEAATGDYPAVFGWDTLILDGGERPGSTEQSDEENIDALAWAFVHGDARGGINTLSAHLPNFVTGDTFHDTSGNVVRHILPGGDKHEVFNAYLDKIAAAATRAIRDDGTLIPVIFRPFHENRGGWFWWGAGHTTTSEYQEIFRYTVEYLRDRKGVHNLLYSFSPNSTVGDPEAYLKTYPGDEFVDVLGFDSYDDSSSAEGSAAWHASLVTDLAMISDLADDRGKVAALTEYGQAGQEDAVLTWHTDLLAVLQADAGASRMAYMLTWANFGPPNRAYVPYPAYGDTAAHPLLRDFQAFHADADTVFASDLAGVYDIRTKAAKEPVVVHLVTPTDRARVETTTTTVRVRVTGGRPSRATFSVDGGREQRLRLDRDGFWSATWEIDEDWLDNRSVTLTTTVKVKGKTYENAALVLLGAVEPLPLGWVDDFEGYAGDDVTLSESYSHVNSNTTALSADHKRAGDYGLAYSYDFSAASYTGIGKSVGQDWSGFSALHLWLEGDGSANGGTLQIVADGVYFESAVSLSSTTGEDVEAPFSGFAPAPWDTGNAGKVLDAEHLAQVTTFNLYLGLSDGGATTGTVYVDDIRAE